MRYLIILFLGLSCMACRKNTYCIKSIENRGSRPVHVTIYRTVINSTEQYKEVFPGEVYVFRQESEKGLNPAAPDCTDGIDSMRIAIRDQFGFEYLSNTPWWDTRRWERSKAQPESFVEHTCNLVVSDSQFVLPF